MSFSHDLNNQIQVEYSTFLPISTKLILLVIVSLYKTKLVDPWDRQKCDQHVLLNKGCNGRNVTSFSKSLSRMSQERQKNDVKIEMADVKAKYYKVNLI